MKSSPFVPEVKERQPGQSCFVSLNTDQDIGLGSKQIVFDLPDGTSIEQAQELARALRSFRVRVRIA